MNVAHTSIDLKNDKANYNKSAGYTQAEIDELEKLIECGFEDSYRRLYPETEAYTFWSYRGGGRQKNVGWRLDYFLLQVKSLVEFVIRNIISGRESKMARWQCHSFQCHGFRPLSNWAEAEHFRLENTTVTLLSKTLPFTWKDVISNFPRMNRLGQVSTVLIPKRSAKAVGTGTYRRRFRPLRSNLLTKGAYIGDGEPVIWTKNIRI